MIKHKSWRKFAMDAMTYNDDWENVITGLGIASQDKRVSGQIKRGDP